jgi:hypothetical protein
MVICYAAIENEHNFKSTAYPRQLFQLQELRILLWGRQICLQKFPSGTDSLLVDGVLSKNPIKICKDDLINSKILSFVYSFKKYL